MSKHHNFFNVITLPEGKEEEAFEAWKAVGRYMETQDGFIGSTLYRNRREPKMLINHGKYTSEETFMASVRSPEFAALSEMLTELGVERNAGLYDPIHDFGDGAGG